MLDWASFTPKSVRFVKTLAPRLMSASFALIV